MLTKQDREFNQIEESAIRKIDKLNAFDAEIKQAASAFFRSAREAEDCSAKYQKIKYDAELNYITRRQGYDFMMTHLTKLATSQVAYKQIVDEANNFIQKFRKGMLKKCRLVRNLEFARCAQIHSCINQFVVFEQSAEMNNKYDLNNFAKILENFTQQSEIKTVDMYLYGKVQDKSLDEMDISHLKLIDRSKSNNQRESQEDEAREPEP